MRLTLKLIVFGVLAGTALTAGPIVTLSPSGNLSGRPGTTVGWGFTLTNDVNWIEVVQSQFCLDSPLHNPCFNASIQYTDIISNPPNDVIVGPAGSASQPYDPGNNQGMGSFAIDPGAPYGSSVKGSILVTYNTFDGDPNNGGNQIGFNDAISALASVTSVPEPATLGLAGMALAAAGVLRLRRRT